MLLRVHQREVLTKFLEKMPLTEKIERDNFASFFWNVRVRNREAVDKEHPELLGLYDILETMLGIPAVKVAFRNYEFAFEHFNRVDHTEENQDVYGRACNNLEVGVNGFIHEFITYYHWACGLE